MKKQQEVTMFFVILTTFSLVSPVLAQSGDRQCEQCGMTVDAIGQERFRIFDSNGTRHYACCPICALKLIKTYGELDINSFCDLNGPNFPITIKARQYGSFVSVSPTTARIILGGGCTKNRLVSNAAAADALLAPPNNGTSKWLSPITNATVLSNASRIGVVQAALQQGGGVNTPCEQCGMTVDATGQARFRILDVNGNTHVACCPICMLKLLKTYRQLIVTSYCDYYGPSCPITMSLKEFGSQIDVKPSDALVILGGGCTKNRIVYNSSAADALLAPPNNGTSKWLSPLTNATVLPNATRMTVAAAALQYGGSPTPTPTTSPTATATASPTTTQPPSSTPSQTESPQPSPTQTTKPTSTPAGITTPSPSTQPTATSSPQATLTPSPTTVPNDECEACTMTVTADDRWHFQVTDGSGQPHYVECYMCALNLITRYETLHIVSFCDWYGPDYPITVDSTGYGAQVTANPTTAMYVYTGGCDNNRVAYNQTAADMLKNGYSQYTSVLQQHAWPMSPTVVSVAEGIRMYNANAPPKGAESTLLIVLVAVACVVTAAAGLFAYSRARQSVSNMPP